MGNKTDLVISLGDAPTRPVRDVVQETTAGGLGFVVDNDGNLLGIRLKLCGQGEMTSFSFADIDQLCEMLTPPEIPAGLSPVIQTMYENISWDGGAFVTKLSTAKNARAFVVPGNQIDGVIEMLQTLKAVAPAKYEQAKAAAAAEQAKKDAKTTK